MSTKFFEEENHDIYKGITVNLSSLDSKKCDVNQFEKILKGLKIS
jgi:hypothetical protein